MDLFAPHCDACNSELTAEDIEFNEGMDDLVCLPCYNAAFPY